MRVYGTGRIDYASEKKYISPVIVRGLLEQVYRSGYWQLPVNNSTKTGMTDGSTWRLEVAAHGRHHVVYDRSPDSGAIYDLGRRMLQYAGLKDQEIY